jgi:hypothetical protein
LQNRHQFCLIIVIMVKSRRIKCPYYEEIRMRYCKAFEQKILIPDNSGEEKYCTCENYVKCVVFAEHKEPEEQNMKKDKRRKS